MNSRRFYVRSSVPLEPQTCSKQLDAAAYAAAAAAAAAAILVQEGALLFSPRPSLYQTARNNGEGGHTRGLT